MTREDMVYPPFRRFILFDRPDGRRLYHLDTVGGGERFVVQGAAMKFYPVFLDAPEHVRLAFRAGEPVEPVIDWLVETYGDAHPFLHDLARAAAEST